MKISKSDHFTRIATKAESLVGFTIALILLIGRWDPTRLEGTLKSASFVLEPRFWLILAFYILSLFIRPRILFQKGYLVNKTQIVFSVIFLFYIVLSVMWAPDVQL